MIVLAVVLDGSNIQTIANPIRSLPHVVAFTQLSASTPTFPDRIVASKTVVGYFSNFIWGDYFYAIVRTNHGNIKFSIDRNEDCFLAYHQKSRLSIQYDIVQRYLPQVGGYYSIDIIRKIKTDRADLATWNRSISPAKLQQCRRTIEQATT